MVFDLLAILIRPRFVRDAADAIKSGTSVSLPQLKKMQYMRWSNCISGPRTSAAKAVEAKTRPGRLSQSYVKRTFKFIQYYIRHFLEKLLVKLTISLCLHRSAKKYEKKDDAGKEKANKKDKKEKDKEKRKEKSKSKKRKEADEEEQEEEEEEEEAEAAPKAAASKRKAKKTKWLKHHLRGFFSKDRGVSQTIVQRETRTSVWDRPRLLWGVWQLPSRSFLSCVLSSTRLSLSSKSFCFSIVFFAIVMSSALLIWVEACKHTT